jgi:hypothetical protein
MSGIRFTEEQQILLSRNPYVANVTEKSITYSEDFKIHAINEYTRGKTPSQIFKEALLDPKIVGAENPKRSLSRWKSVYFREGSSGLMGEKRGCGNSGRPKTSDMSLEERLIAAEAKITYLQMENEFLKKLDALERGLKK